MILHWLGMVLSRSYWVFCGSQGIVFYVFSILGHSAAINLERKDIDCDLGPNMSWLFKESKLAPEPYSPTSAQLAP